jgi:RecB family endonuclease NucS
MIRDKGEMLFTESLNIEFGELRNESDHSTSNEEMFVITEVENVSTDLVESIFQKLTIFSEKFT